MFQVIVYSAWKISKYFGSISCHFLLNLFQADRRKLPDVCYSWWVLASLKIIGKLHWIDKVNNKQTTTITKTTAAVTWKK